MEIIVLAVVRRVVQASGAVAGISLVHVDVGTDGVVMKAIFRLILH